MTSSHRTRALGDSSHRRLTVVLAVTASFVALVTGSLSAQQKEPDSADSAAAMSLIQASDRPMAQGSASRETQERAIGLLQQAVTLARRGGAPTVEGIALYRISYL